MVGLVLSVVICGWFGDLVGGGCLLVCCVLCFRWRINGVVVSGIAFACGV